MHFVTFSFITFETPPIENCLC